jgi:uncharacterized protein YndB with AHSA1/START domain
MRARRTTSRRKDEVMYTIENQIEIDASAARILEALTTKAGIQGWWTKDTEIDARTAVFRFHKETGTREMRFEIAKRDAARIEMVCVAETNSADWLGTRLSFALAPAGARTRVALEHAGYPAKNEVYEMCTKGWAFFLGSLKSYVETGKGEPHGATKAITNAIEVAASPAKVIEALSTSAGIAAWWTTDNTVTASTHTYRFGKDADRAEATFRIDAQDHRGIALVCTGEQNGMGWLGTRLAFAVEPMGSAGARVALAHAGFALDSNCYDECVGGWQHFLGSLKAYLETGKGTPHVPAVNDCH